MRVQNDNLAMNKTELMNITCTTNYSIYTWDYVVSCFKKEHIFKLNYIIGIATYFPAYETVMLFSSLVPHWSLTLPSEFP